MHDCECCGDIIYSDDPLCDCCKEAGCEANAAGDYDDCQIPSCPECETPATFMTDGKWHENCDCSFPQKVEA
jgi:hypothetical protein